MKAIPVYCPEIQVFRLAPDGQWDSEFGANTAHLFHPMADEAGDAPSENGLRRVVANGAAPAFTILAPDDHELVTTGRVVRLRNPNGKYATAFDALTLARRRDDGFDLLRPGMEVPEPPKPRGIVVTFGPAPAVAPRPTRQLALFGEESP